MGDFNVENQLTAGKNVSLPTVSRKTYHQTIGQTLFKMFQYKGENKDTVELFADDGNLPSTAVVKESLPQGQYGVAVQVGQIYGSESFGDNEAIPTNLSSLAEIRFAINNVTSPLVPVRGEMAKKALENFFKDDAESETKISISNWFSSYLDTSLVQTFFNGASANLLAPATRGGLAFQFAGRTDMAGMAQMPRHVWYSDTAMGKNGMKALDWEVVHGGGFASDKWNNATQNVILQVSGSGNEGFLTKEKLEEISIFTQDNKFSAARLMSSTTNHVLVVSPREVMALRRSLDDKLVIEVQTLINQLSWFGFQKGFLCCGVLVIGHPIMDKMKPRVSIGANKTPVFGVGMFGDARRYQPSAEDNVSVGMLLGRGAIITCDDGAIETKTARDDFDEIKGYKQSLVYGAVRTEFTEVSVNSKEVDMRDRDAVRNESSALILFKSANIANG